MSPVCLRRQRLIPQIQHERSRPDPQPWQRALEPIPSRERTRVAPCLPALR